MCPLYIARRAGSVNLPVLRLTIAAIHPLCTDAQLVVEQCCALGILGALLTPTVKRSVSSDLVAAIELAALRAPAITGDGVELVVDIYPMYQARLGERTDLNEPAAAAGKML